MAIIPSLTSSSPFATGNNEDMRLEVAAVFIARDPVLTVTSAGFVAGVKSGEFSA